MFYMYVIIPGPMLLVLLFSLVINRAGSSWLWHRGERVKPENSGSMTSSQFVLFIHQKLYLLDIYLFHPYSAMQRNRFPDIGDHQTVVDVVIIKPRLHLPCRGHRQLLVRRWPLVARPGGAGGGGGQHCRCLARHGVIGSNNGID